jgi:hypothetical protein
MHGITAHCLAALTAKVAPQAAADLLHSTPDLPAWLLSDLKPAGKDQPQDNLEGQLHTLSLLQQLINLASWQNPGQMDVDDASSTTPGSAIAACLQAASVPQRIAEMHHQLCLRAAATPLEERVGSVVECCYQALVQHGVLADADVRQQTQQQQQSDKTWSVHPQADQDISSTPGMTPHHATHTSAHREGSRLEAACRQHNLPEQVCVL